MDHLPLPPNPVIGSLPVPFFCNEPYDGGPFLTYPVRTGWNVTEYHWPKILSRHGKDVCDEAQIASFMQTWLYFGLLCEITGSSVDAAAFRAPGRTRNAPLFSSKPLVDIVSKWSLETMTLKCELDEDLRDRLGEDAELVDPFETWVSKQDDIVDAAQETWTRIIYAYEDTMTDALSLVLLSIAALGDYLSQTLAEIARARDAGDGTPSTCWVLPESVCHPISRKLQNWCPNRLHSFITTRGCAIGVLWYIANLEPPKVRDDHCTCSPELCNSFYIDEHNYNIRHVAADCGCDLKSPLTKEMVSIVRQGSIALFTIQHDVGEATLLIQDQKRARNYIAISHVWADGHGNLQNNSLPKCVLEKLQRNVDALGASNSRVQHTPIWMDTICLPRFPRDLRKQALLRLNDVFSKASGVLVLDSYLQASNASSMAPIEILARISISGWTTRLWTFSEGRLARRVWFQFRDRAIDLYDLMRNWQEQLKLRALANPLTSVSYGMTALHSSTELLESGQDREWPLELGHIKMALISRQTSWPSDEALCLGAILKLDLSSIVEAEDSKRMTAFWRQVEHVPINLIFTSCSPKLEDPGYRWAPATLLGGANPGLAMLAFEDPVKIATRYVSRTEVGLEFSVGTILPITAFLPMSQNTKEEARDKKRNFISLCRQSTVSAANKAIMLKDVNGTWYSCVVEKLWHQTPIIPNFEDEMPVFFSQLHVDIDTIRHQNDMEVWNRHSSVFATYKLSREPLFARAHTLVTLSVLPSKRCQAFDSLLQYALAFKKQCKRASLGFPDKGDEILDDIVAWAQAVDAEEALNDLAAKILPYESWGVVVESGVRICARYICYFCLVDEWYKVKISDPHTRVRWCID